MNAEIVAPPVDWLGLHRDYLIHGEMDVIAALVRSVDPTVMVEIGCRDGRTAAVLLANVPSIERYIGIDVPVSYVPKLSQQRSETVPWPGHLAQRDPRFELIIRDRGSLDLAPQDLPQCDAVFIDGDHSEAAVEHDSNLAHAITRPGGIIIWHDLNNSTVEVTRVIERLRADGWPIMAVDRTWLAFCRMPQ